MLLCDPTEPVIVQTVPQALGLGDALLVAVALDFLNQRINPPENPSILLLPPKIVLPRIVIPDDGHSCRR